jgi:hypothetical protein
MQFYEGRRKKKGRSAKLNFPKKGRRQKAEGNEISLDHSSSSLLKPASWGRMGALPYGKIAPVFKYGRK